MKKETTIRVLGLFLLGLFLCVSPVIAQTADDTVEIIHDENCTHGEEQLDSVTTNTTTTVDPTASDPTEPVDEEEIEVAGWVEFLFSGKYLMFLVLSLVALVLLLGNWINICVRTGVMILAFVLFGIDQFYPMHPSPMCATTKLFMFKFTWGEFFPAFIAMFVAIFLPSLIGRKLFCGWVCPLGAFQELINKIPFPRKYKQFNFTAFNFLRGGLFVMFFLVFFAVKEHIEFLGVRDDADLTSNLWIAMSSFNVYEPVNLFELLHWQPSSRFWIMLTMLVGASLVLYRPFCYAICPIGFLSWLFEKISPGRVRVNMADCTQCGICVEKSPCPTIKPMLDESTKSLPDCTSCGECLKTCPTNAITFGFAPKK